MAPGWIANVLQRGSSVLRVFKNEVDFTNQRNARECQALARIIDALRKNDITAALEYAVRRCAGVQTADTTGKWDMCDQFEHVTDKQSFVPDAILQRAVKNVMRQQALTKGTTSSSSSSLFGNTSNKSKARTTTGGKGNSGGRNNNGGSSHNDRTSNGGTHSSSNKKHGGERGASNH